MTKAGLSLMLAATASVAWTADPTGCPPFAVERPRVCGDRVVKAVDFGFSTDNDDNGAAVNRALAEAARLGADTVELAPGTYRCFSPTGIVISGRSDFTVDGKGATLVFRRPLPDAVSPVPQWAVKHDDGCFSVRDCTRVWLKGFNVDWDWASDPLASKARVAAVHGEEPSFVDFDLPEGHPAYPAPVPTLVAEAMDETFTRFRNGPGHFFASTGFGGRGLRNEWIGPKRLRVHFPANAAEPASRFDIGGTYRLLHSYYGDNAFTFDSNRHLTISRVNVFAARGMAFHVSGKQKFWRLEDCSVAPPEGSGRVISSTADANHVAQSCGYCQMVNFRVNLNSDDCNNFHDRTTIAVKSGDRGLKVVNARGPKFFGAKAGDEIELLNADFSPTGWRGRVAAVTDNGYEMDRETPRETNYAFVLANREYGTDNILLSGCEFTDATARTLVHGCNVTIENCAWKRTCGTPLRFLAVWTKNAWCEGTGCRNVVVRNCSFEGDNIWRWNVRNRTAEIVSFAFTPERFGENPGDNVPEIAPWDGAVSDILVENCVFTDPLDLTWQQAAGTNLISRNNRVAGMPAKFVNAFVGTDFNGHTFPGATWPNGMVQPSPDSGWKRWAHCSGYRIKDPQIYGFSQTHLSGTGIGDLMDVLLQPYSGEDGDVHHRGVKTDETAEPGYYAVSYSNFGVRTELTASRRVAYHRYTFVRGGARVLVDLSSGMNGAWFRPAGTWPSNRVVEATWKFEGDRKLVGHNVVAAWLRRRDVNYVVEFSRPIAWKRRAPATQEGQIAPRWELGFDLEPGERLEARIAISPVDVASAARTLAAEPDGFDFDARRAACTQAWNGLLGKMEVEGDEARKRVFYTALYHAYVQPNLFSDVGCKEEYTTFSNWDTYRAAYPLYTILTPELSRGIVNSMVEHGLRNGRLSVWELWGKDTDCMPGDHAVPAIVDAILKGIGGIDEEKAFRVIDRRLRMRYSDVGYDTLGYYPCDKGTEATSRTIESSYDDWCAHLLAKRLGRNEDAAFYLKRSRYWRNHWDLSVQALRPKDSHGKWLEPFNIYERQPPRGPRQFTEGSALHYLWHVQHDPEGLIGLMGRAAFADRLEGMFTLPEDMPGQGRVGDCTGAIGQYVHGNEPCQHDVYLLPYVGRNRRAAELVREICDRFYTNTADGLPGNDDCGQTSAWYVFSTMGFYPMNPCGGEYVLGAPQFRRIKLALPNGKAFEIVARNLSHENKYVKSVSLNGRRLDGFTLRHEDILVGGCLEFEMER